MMSPFRLLHGTVDALRRAPGIRYIRKKRFDRRFENAKLVHLFRGIYDSFEAAAAAAPPMRPQSHNSPDGATMYDNQMRVQQTDYPAMFWLTRALEDSARSIFDLGGHVGIKYYAFKDCIRFPDDLRWTVCDLPMIVDRGTRLARERGAERNLSFTVRATDADGSDVLYASGSLQYLPFNLAELLSGLEKKPSMVVVNITPLHPNRSFFTINAIGVAFCPYRVTSEAEFVESMCAQGYAVRDRWKNVGKSMSLPFERGYDVEAYSGFCFTRE